ncbi:hypothetical protein [unidentified bacterial endosymbiont]|nr:hypothetical protein [unidentified bacterial endosymbiont]
MADRFGRLRGDPATALFQRAALGCLAGLGPQGAQFSHHCFHIQGDG